MNIRFLQDMHQAAQGLTNSLQELVNDFNFRLQLINQEIHKLENIENEVVRENSTNETPCIKKEPTYHVNKKDPVVKINSLAQINFNRILCEQRNLYKYRYVKAFPSQTTLVLCLLEKKEDPDDEVLPIHKKTLGLIVSCKGKLFKESSFVMEKKNEILSYKFLSDNIIEIKLPLIKKDKTENLF